MWKQIQSETDDDKEWLPSPTQRSALTDMRFTPEMVQGWDDFLDEAEKILKGELLVVFWRGTDRTRGVNFSRFFDRPKDFDFVLWIHGAGAEPFIEKGEVSSPETWERFERIFQGNFFGVAMWVN